MWYVSDMTEPGASGLTEKSLGMPIDGVSKLLSGKASAPEHSSDDQKTYCRWKLPKAHSTVQTLPSHSCLAKH